jgi:hypothetical protein
MAEDARRGEKKKPKNRYEKVLRDPKRFILA